MSGVDTEDGIGWIGVWGDGVDGGGLGNIRPPVLGRGSSDNRLVRLLGCTGAGICLVPSALEKDNARLRGLTGLASKDLWNRDALGMPELDGGCDESPDDAFGGIRPESYDMV